MGLKLRPRDQVRLGASRTTRKRSLDSLHEPQGAYHVVDDLAGLRHRRAEGPVPPFTESVVLSASADDWSPRIARSQDCRLWVLFVRNDGDAWDGYQTFSDDDGLTWTEATEVFSGATFVEVQASETTAMVLRAGLVGGTVFVAQQEAPGAPVGSEVSTGVTLDEGQFTLSPVPEAALEWLLGGVSGGAAVYYRSTDDGISWESI